MILRGLALQRMHDSVIGRGFVTKEEIKAWLKESGHDRDWLGAQLGVSRRTVDNWLSSNIRIPGRKLLAIGQDARNLLCCQDLGELLAADEGAGRQDRQGVDDHEMEHLHGARVLHFNRASSRNDQPKKAP